MEFKTEFNQMNDSYLIDNNNGYHIQSTNDQTPKRR